MTISAASATALTGAELERSGPGWARARVDPAGPLLALVAGVVYALHGFGHYLSRDLALYAYAGQRVADGVAPYEGVVNRAGPLSHLVPGVGAFLGRLVGVDDLLAMRAFFLVLSSVCVWLAYLMGRDLLHSRAAGWSVAAALLYVNGFTQYATGGPREKTTLVLFLLAALIAVARRSPLWAASSSAWRPSPGSRSSSWAWRPGLVALSALDRGRRLRGLRRVLGRRPGAPDGVPGVLRRARPPAGLPRLLRADPPRYTEQEGFQSEPEEIWEQVQDWRTARPSGC